MQLHLLTCSMSKSKNFSKYGVTRLNMRPHVMASDRVFKTCGRTSQICGRMFEAKTHAPISSSAMVDSPVSMVFDFKSPSCLLVSFRSICMKGFQDFCNELVYFFALSITGMTNTFKEDSFISDFKSTMISILSHFMFNSSNPSLIYQIGVLCYRYVDCKNNQVTISFSYTTQ